MAGFLNLNLHQNQAGRPLLKLTPMSHSSSLLSRSRMGWGICISSKFLEAAEIEGSSDNVPIKIWRCGETSLLLLGYLSCKAFTQGGSSQY